MDNYGKKTIDDVPVSAKLINDFKNPGYDANEIINEYTTALSLRERGNSKTIWCPNYPNPECCPKQNKFAFGIPSKHA